MTTKLQTNYFVRTDYQTHGLFRRAVMILLPFALIAYLALPLSGAVAYFYPQAGLVMFAAVAGLILLIMTSIGVVMLISRVVR